MNIYYRCNMLNDDIDVIRFNPSYEQIPVSTAEFKYYSDKIEAVYYLKRRAQMDIEGYKLRTKILAQQVKDEEAAKIKECIERLKKLEAI